MRLPPPPPRERPAPPLAAQIDRDFGSLEDFLRILAAMTADGRHGGTVWLVCTDSGRLRLVHTPPHVMPRGRVLLRFPTTPGPHPPGPPRPNWREASEQYDRHIHHRPPYPMP